jgi:hypothetical protein
MLKKLEIIIFKINVCKVFWLAPHICLLLWSGGMPVPLAGNTKGGSISVPLTSSLTGLESVV